MDNNGFCCNFCNYTSKRKYDITRHQNAKHNENKYKNQNEKKHIQNEKKHIQNEKKHIQNGEKPIQNGEKHIQNDKNEIYTCIKCNKCYKTAKSYKNHEETCKGINILTCSKCMKTFSSTSNKSKHIKKNSCKAKSIIHLDNEYIKKELYINGNNNNNVITNNVIINNYGNERTDYITFDDMMRILNSGNNIIPRYIEFKHFNKDFPENHNIKYTKNYGCIVKKNDKWTLININYLTDNLFKNNSYELQNYYNNKKKEIDEKIKNLELIELIYSRLNYLDLCINKDILNNIKNEIKNKIRSISIYM
jgi:flagellar motor protein MotB